MGAVGAARGGPPNGAPFALPGGLLGYATVRRISQRTFDVAVLLADVGYDVATIERAIPVNPGR